MTLPQLHSKFGIAMSFSHADDVIHPCKVMLTILPELTIFYTVVLHHFTTSYTIVSAKLKGNYKMLHYLVRGLIQFSLRLNAIEYCGHWTGIYGLFYNGKTNHLSEGLAGICNLQTERLEGGCRMHQL